MHVSAFLISVLSRLNSIFSAKKRTLWSLERALSLLQLPPRPLAPEPQGSTLRLWSTAPKTLALLTLKVPSGALCPPPPSVCLLSSNFMLCFPHFMIKRSGTCVCLHACMCVCVHFKLKWLWVISDPKVLADVWTCLSYKQQDASFMQVKKN